MPTPLNMRRPLNVPASYNKAPTYEDEKQQVSLQGVTAPPAQPGQQTPATPTNNLRQAAANAVQSQQTQVPTTVPDYSGIKPPSNEPVKGYGGMLKTYLDQAFGSGRSFDPIEQKITQQRDDSLRGMAEKLASRGMGNSGLAAAGAQDIYGQAADQSAEAFQNWREQGVQDMRAAISPFVEQDMASRLLGQSTDARKELINSQVDADLRKLFGDDEAAKSEGSAKWDFMSTVLGKGEPTDEMKTYLERWMRERGLALIPQIDSTPPSSGGSGSDSTLASRESSAAYNEWLAKNQGASADAKERAKNYFYNILPRQP